MDLPEEVVRNVLERFQNFRRALSDGETENFHDYFDIHNNYYRDMIILYKYDQKGALFATIDELFERDEIEIKANEWDSLKKLVWRSGPPNFERRRLAGDTNRNPLEYLATIEGAHLNDVDLDSKETFSTVNDELIPCDIFGKSIFGKEKGHLLPKARDIAITWGYPASAVLGLRAPNGSPMVGTDSFVRKAVLGCKTTKTTTTDSVRYPGIRNMLSNLVRMRGLKTVFDDQPNVCIFPIYNLKEAKDWNGQGYEAIVVCADGQTAQLIGMVAVQWAEAANFTANVTEINKAVGLASAICKFLAHSVLQKNKKDVDEYQKDNEEIAHAKFREERKIEVPRPLTSSTPPKPVYKISFEKHDAKEGHPAPDPMLLAFKSCKNWCQKFSGFQMVAAPEEEDSDDGLSEEGKQNLQAYIEWQAEQEKRLRHDEIMNLFGYNGKGVETMVAAPEEEDSDDELSEEGKQNL